jgi:hypothetical protein
MEVLLFLGGLWLLFWLGPKIYGFFNPPAERPTWTPSPSTDRPSPKPDPGKYRPHPPGRKPKIQFGPASPGPAPDLKDLHDAFTGALLLLALCLSPSSMSFVHCGPGLAESLPSTAGLYRTVTRIPAGYRRSHARTSERTP